jgi:hypothetical protein
MRRLKRVGAVLGGAAAITLTAGVGFAFWTTDASVSAEGATGSTSSVTARNAAISPALIPGSCSDITFTLHNPNDTASPGIREVTKFDFGSVDGAQNYLRSPYILEKNTPNATLIANGYVFESIPANGDRQVTLPNAICLTQDAPDSVKAKTVTANLDLAFKLAPATEYTGS